MLFCHADLVSGPDGVRRVAAEPLAELLASGGYPLVWDSWLLHSSPSRMGVGVAMTMHMLFRSII